MFRALITATVLGAAALCAGAVPAAAATPVLPMPKPATGVPATGSALGTAGDGAAPARKTELTLSYMAEAGYARAVVLTCNPPGGGHPKPVKACNTLSKVGGRPTGLKPARTMCMM